MTLHWICKPHAELSPAELYAILRLRCEVFVVEQHCVYQDIDGQDFDGDCRHLMAWNDATLVAYLRLLDPHLHDGEVKVGRVVTAPAARGSGLGHQLMGHALEHAALLWPQAPLSMSAQAHLQAYYGRYGFTACSDEYLEDGIPHVQMRRHPQG